MKTIFDITIDLEKSFGSVLCDAKTGKEYLDLFNMYSSLPLGYNHPIFDEEFERKASQLAKIRVSNNAFKTKIMDEFLEEFTPFFRHPNFHFSCTGALAVESGLKCAMEYKKVENPIVLGVKKGFHGINSWGFVTDRYLNTGKRMEFFPKNNWLNLDLMDLANFIQDDQQNRVVAVIVEPIQCTAGDIYLDADLLRQLQDACRERDICFIVDEIQTGFGTTGSMWYSEKIGLDPDIIVFGKKSQICGISVADKYKEAITHEALKLGVTFDGELMDALRATYILKAMKQDGLLGRAAEVGKIFEEKIADRVQNFRGEGLLAAFDFETKALRDSFLAGCLQNNILCNSGGEKSVRLRPNFAITKADISRFVAVFDEVYSSLD